MRKEKRVCVVGFGVMGSGIAQLCANADYDITVVSRSKESLKLVFARFGECVVRATISLKEGARDADFVIEAVYENLELKSRIFHALDRICPQHTILASNASAIPITVLAGATKRPANVVGIHFMNPPSLMKGVELIRTPLTSEDTVERATSFVLALGKEPIKINDAPGFVANRLLFSVFDEAVGLYESGVASQDDIDKIARLCLNWKMGPFRLMDLIGVDIMLSILDTISYEELRASLKRQYPRKV